MSTEAQLFTLCPLDIAIKLDILDYPRHLYRCDDDHEIITALGFVYTRSSYEELCYALDLIPYDVAYQEVTKIPNLDFLMENEWMRDMISVTASLIALGHRVWMMVSF